ncbi:glycosyltransferase family 2 protein [Paenarthrobacter aurescens]|uniref:Glycosyl transferase, group 2 family protein n=1 Tax=Paenarthrobacter aurescens (strain TC1) TaxID=290340 RepID=A1R9F1_PAEAT|nr:glycosyltransferase family 2 protein [Paenarthrobacter aurescens]ABM08167.1 glycosyl transferase, group 2 family protein [Paenarthrobacter aurescens TC1]
MSVRISVVIAARNEELRIGNCISSLLKVLGDDDEIIVINDGSTDGTRAEVLSFSDARVRLLENAESRGRGASRNFGIANAKGRYIAIQDADDVALPGRIEIPLALMESQPDLVAASGQCIAVTKRGVYWRHRKYPLLAGDVADEFRRSTMAVCHTGSLIRRSALDEVGLYDTSLVRAQDLELFKRLAMKGPIRNSPLDVVLYTHDAWLSWNYWRTSRRNHDVIAGRAGLPLPALVGRYLLAMVRRQARKFSTSRTARVAYYAVVGDGS